MKFHCPNCEAAFDADPPEEDELLQCPECGSRFEDPDRTVLDEQGPLAAEGLLPGKRLGGFVIEERIGFGGMGEVYKATQLSLDRIVALKVLPPAFAERPLFVRRFYEESTALSALNHPNIVTIYERGNVGKFYYFAMEYVDGMPLHLITWSPADVQQFLNVAKGTAAALSYAQERGVVHRDIKPANIMLSHRNEVKITDFGLASLMADEQGRLEDAADGPVAMGTPAYMSPEQREDAAAVDGRSDIFSAGLVFHELMTGRRPEIPLEAPPSEIHQMADPRLDPIVTHCLQEDPEDRYQHAGELLQDLEEFERELMGAPPCPECQRLNPVRSQTCIYCGADLEELFDICPECKRKNRREVRHCLYCGVDLEKGRTIMSRKMGMMLDQADRLRLDGNYSEALEMLEEVQDIEGRVVEHERQRARSLHESIVMEREETAVKAYEEAMRLLKLQRFREAIELFKRVPEDIRDTSREIEKARQLQARLAAERRSQATTNLILIAVGLLILLVLLLALLLA
ncbi:MAG: protein kinase [Candidatus Brocadiia bacterium]